MKASKSAVRWLVRRLMYDFLYEDMQKALKNFKQKLEVQLDATVPSKLDLNIWQRNGRGVGMYTNREIHVIMPYKTQYEALVEYGQRRDGDVCHVNRDVVHIRFEVQPEWMIIVEEEYHGPDRSQDGKSRYLAQATMYGHIRGFDKEMWATTDHFEAD